MNDEQRRMSGILSSPRVGLLKTAIIAVMVAVGAIGCDVKIEVTPSKNLTEHITKDLKHFMVNKGATFKDSEFGQMVNSTEEEAKFYDTGEKETVSLAFYDFDKDGPRDLSVYRRSNGDVVYIIVDTFSPSYKKIIKVLGKRVYAFTAKVNPGFKITFSPHKF